MRTTLEELEQRARSVLEDQLARSAVPDGVLAILLDLLFYLRTHGDDTEQALRARLQMALDREALLTRELSGATLARDNEAARARLLEQELEKWRGDRDAPAGLCSSCGAKDRALTCWACAQDKHRVAAGGDA